MAKKNLTIEYVPTDSLHPHPDNPRRGDLEAIKRSLRHHDQYKPLVANRRTREVLCGNHTLLAARAIGLPVIATTFVDVDEDQARRIMLVDNRTSDLAVYDDQELAELLGELPDLVGTGFDEAALSELLDGLAPAPPEEDEPPEVPEQPRTRPGELITLGDHRLLCADAREPESYFRLMGDEHAELLWTDPPYGVSYQGKTKAALRIEGDGAAGLEALLSESFAAADAALAPGARLYVAHPAGALSLTFGGCFKGQGWRLRQTLVWVKDAFVLGRCDYHYRHEPILYGHKPGPGRIGRGAAGWYGDNAQDSVLEVARPRASRDHPTMKPPELVERCLRNSTRRGDLVLDPFGGSGSTLVACETSGRAARLLEADPRFCDVIVGRFERLTGGQAERSRPMTCTAHTKAGRRCRRPALGGRDTCCVHSGARVGRPSKLTDEVARKICDAVRAGSYLSVAARCAGVSESTVYEWLGLAREPGADLGLVAFAAAIDKADADGEVHTIGMIRREIARGNTRAGFEFLARRHPERWTRGRPSPYEPSGPAEEPEPAERPLDLSRLSDEDYEALKEIRRRAHPDG